MVGKVIRLWLEDGETLAVDPQHEGAIDAAFGEWVRSNINTPLRLTLLHGDDAGISASSIMRWAVSTPEGRKNATMLGVELDMEDLENRREAGLPDDTTDEPWRNG